VQFLADVDSLVDAGNLLQGASRVGQVLRGTYSYALNATDTNPNPNIGEYHYLEAGYHFQVNADGMLFSADPDAMHLVFRLTDNFIGGDTYVFESLNNLPTDDGITVTTFRFELIDPLSNANQGTVPPSVPPHLGR
jgi:hypothetical protein